MPDKLGDLLDRLWNRVITPAQEKQLEALLRSIELNKNLPMEMRDIAAQVRAAIRAQKI